MANLTRRLKKTFWFDYRTDLPQWLSAGIGQTIVEWATLERELEGIIRILIDSETEHTRILLLKMNTRSRNEIIRTLIDSHLLRGSLTKRDRKRFQRIEAYIDKAAPNRNLLAHGLWAKRGNSWKVLNTRSVRSIPELQPTFKKLPRSVLPQSIAINRAKLRSICGRTVALSKQLERLSSRLERALGPLRHIPPPYTRKRPNYRNPDKGP
jgi:hypothetical protein